MEDKHTRRRGKLIDTSLHPEGEQSNNDLENELDFVGILANEDAENQCVLQDELDHCNEILTKDLFDSFAWNKRYFIVTRHCNMGKFTFEMMKKEAHDALRAIEVHPENEGPWTYLRWVCKDNMKYLSKHMHPESSYAKVLMDEAERGKINEMDAILFGGVDLPQINSRGCEHALNLIVDLMVDHAYIPSTELKNAIKYLFGEWESDPSTSDLRKKFAESWDRASKWKWEDM